MSYTELEHGYQGLRKHRRSSFFLGESCPMRSIRRDEYSDSSDEDNYDSDKKQVIVGICAMEKKSQSKPMKEILSRLEEFEYIRVKCEDNYLGERQRTRLHLSKKGKSSRWKLRRHGIVFVTGLSSLLKTPEQLNENEQSRLRFSRFSCCNQTVSTCFEDVEPEQGRKLNVLFKISYRQFSLGKRKV